MKYSNRSVKVAKTKLVSRLSFIINNKLRTTTGKAIANRINVSPGMISLLKHDRADKISFDAVLEVAQRLNLKYSILITHNGKGTHNVEVEMEDIYPGLNIDRKTPKVKATATPRRPFH